MCGAAGEAILTTVGAQKRDILIQTHQACMKGSAEVGGGGCYNLDDGHYLLEGRVISERFFF